MNAAGRGSERQSRTTQPSPQTRMGPAGSLGLATKPETKPSTTGSVTTAITDPATASEADRHPADWATNLPAIVRIGRGPIFGGR